MAISKKVWFWAPVAALIALFALVLLLKSLGFGLVQQLTPSMPLGWYWQLPLKQKTLKKGDVVLFWPDPKLERYLRGHHWLGKQMSLMKKVYAAGGDRVCHQGDWLWINGKKVAHIQKDYAAGKALPVWHYCGRVPKGYYVMLGLYSPKSFDSRYFGLVSRGQVFARAKKL